MKARPGEGNVRAHVRGGIPQGSRNHDGHFSIDKKGTWTDTAVNTERNRENAERAYNQIMKEKE